MATITGTTGADILVGTTSADNISGLQGNDSLEGGLGADAMDGGAGTDTITYAHATSGVSAAFTGVDSGSGTAGEAAGDTFTTAEIIQGSAFNDILGGVATGETLRGGTGDDIYVLSGFSGFAAIVENASEGIDEVRTAISGYTLTANVENLTNTGSATWTGSGNALNNIITGGGGNDTLRGGGGADILIGGTGIDIADYQDSSAGLTINLATGISTGIAAGDTYSGIEAWAGSGFNDVLIGDATANTLYGAGGADTIEGGAGADAMDGGLGADTISYANATSGISAAFTGISNPVVGGFIGVGTAGEAAGDTFGSAEIIQGSAFNDTLGGYSNLQTLRGGAGDDLYVLGVDGNTAVVVENAGEGIDEVRTALSNYTLTANVENLTNTGDGSSNWTGIGNALNNVITGGDGTDFLRGGAGADTLIGGAGVDIADYQDSSVAVTVSLATGTGTGIAAGDVYSSIEGLAGSGFNDVLVGDATANTLYGVGGADTLEGGLGADAMEGGLGTDTISYANATSGISAAFTGISNPVVGGFIGAGTAGEAAGDTFGSVEIIQGSAFNDTLGGDSNQQTLRGGGGDDLYVLGGTGNTTVVIENAGEGIDEVRTTFTAYTLTANVENLTNGGDGTWTGTGNALNNIITGGGGNDTLRGGGGADTLIGGAGFDLADYQDSSAAVTINLATGVFTGIAAGDTYSSIEAWAGTAFNDVLVGDATANTLYGVGGADTLEGGLGADAMNGGFGTDTISYANATSGISAAFTGGSPGIEGGFSGVGAAGEAAGDTFASAEIIQGSAFNDTLGGDSSMETLRGGTGDDVYILSGFGGFSAVVENIGEGVDEVRTTLNYTLKANFENLTNTGNGTFIGTGNELNNVITGGGGVDTLVGGLGVDTVNYSNAGGGVTVSLAITTVQATGGAGSDTLTGFENITGSGFADTLTGDAGANVLTGLGGDDTLNGADGNDTFAYSGAANGFDTVAGGTGVNTILATADNTAIGLKSFTDVASISGGGNANVTIQGSSAAETFDFTALTLTSISKIDGGGGADIITGSGGDDTISGGLGDDILAGGAGVDTLSYDQASAGVTVDLSLTSAQATGSAGSDTVQGFENLTGSAFADTLAGDGGANSLIGLGGDDVLSGAGGDDSFSYSGNANGFDTVIGGSGTNAIVATAANTVIGLHALSDIASISSGGFGGVTILGSANADTLDFTGATLTGIGKIDGGAGADVITGSSGADVIVGGLGDDILNGADGDDSFAYAGNANGFDTVSGGAGTNAITATAANTVIGLHALSDIASISSGGFGGVTILGSSNADTLDFTGATLTGIGRIDGASGDDVITGSSGADLIVGGLGDDTLDGSGGVDTLTYDQATAGVAVDLSLTTAQATGGAGNDTLLGFENLTGSAFADTLSGDGGNNILIGLGGDDVLNGGGGDDTFRYSGAASGFDTVHGDAGTNAIVATAANTVIGLHDLSGIASISSGGFSGVTVLGSANADTLDFSGATLTGIGRIDGGGGDDAITGSSGADLIVGGLGDDTLDGSGGVDTLSYDLASAGVTVDLSLTTAQATGGAGADTLSGFENLTGSAFTDTLAGDGGNNVLIGLGGDDVLNGGGGDDTFRYSGAAGGFDTVDGGIGTNAIVATAANTVIGLHAITGVTSISSGGFSGVTIQGSSMADILDFSSATLTGMGKIDGGGGADVITGSSGNNVISGGVGDDILDGGAGADTLSGMDGADTLTGGLGADIFGFSLISDTPVGASDTLTDFLSGTDRIDLSAIDADSISAGDQAFSFIGSGMFTGTAGELRFDTSTPGQAVVMGDVDGDGGADFQVVLLGSAGVMSADFLL